MPMQPPRLAAPFAFVLPVTLATLMGCTATSTVRPAHAVSLETRQLDPDFYAEGCCFTDLDKDGHLDLVAGPWWFAGPDFKVRHEIRTPKKFDPIPFSDNFLTFSGDFNADGWMDILRVGFPGAPASWYQNPAGTGQGWREHPAFGGVDNESPLLINLTGDGQPELLCCHGGCVGYASFDPAKPEVPWVFHPISSKGTYHRYTHGLGVGDVNGDGRLDVLEAGGWREQPAHDDGKPWPLHAAAFGEAPAQMAASDVDGDGLVDVVCAWHCHHYGLAWHRQVRGADGAVRFERHDILPANPDLKDPALRISQMHAQALADMDGDGHLDIVTGKRRWAHGPKGDIEPDAPAVLYWFAWTAPAAPGALPTFTPHLIHDDSGVGTQVSVADVNGDGTPDVAVANKKGIHVHVSR